jgi:multisubunit Na+/H+ antiporter MnhE subunit
MPAVRAWLVWWVLLTALYVVLVDTRRIQELAAAVIVGALGATASVIVRRREPKDVLRPRLRTALRELRAILSWPRDLWLLTGALLRRPRGRIVEVAFDGDASDAAIAVAERSLAPNTVVIDVDEERGVLIYHELVQRSPSTQPEGAERPRGETPWA